LINSCASFDITLHREWFNEYEKHNGGDVFVGDDSKTKIMVRGRVELLMKDGRIRTLLRVMDIIDLARIRISILKLDDACVGTLLGKEACNMVQGEMVLMRGDRCGNIYNLLGITYTNGCNSSIVIEQRNK
jgi:hypothetical protein